MGSLFIVTALLALLILRTPVAFALGGLGVILLGLQGFPLVSVPQLLYGAINSFELLAIPMFLLMSNILLRAGVGQDLFSAVNSWVGHWPGGLAATTILSCTLFSAISGSSVATAVTIGTVAISEMTQRGYDKSFVLGLLAAGGTLGILIPPSIPLILFGVMTETSISTLFLAGIGPGLFLAGVFIVYGMVYSKVSASYIQEPKASWAERWHLSLTALPILLLAMVMIGSIYTGVATPSESASLGFIFSLIITVTMKRMSWIKLKQAVYASLRTTTMIFLIVAGAKVFSYAITLDMIPQEVSSLLTENISQPGLFILAVGMVLLILGFFLESLSMIVIMVPVLFPAIVVMNIDPIWFGIFFVILIEVALITPPVGMNLFVIQAVAKSPFEQVIKGAWPFALIMLATAIFMWYCKSLALYIPYHL